MARISYGSPCKLGLEEDPAKKEAINEINKSFSGCGWFLAICVVLGVVMDILGFLADKFPALKEFPSSL